MYASVLCTIHYMKPKIYINGHCHILLYYPQLHTSDLLVTYPAVFADEYMVLHTWQFMWPFASVCRYCRVHIYGGTIQLRGPLYSHISIYLNFEVYIEFITIYGNVFGYIQCALLLMLILCMWSTLGIENLCECWIISQNAHLFITIRVTVTSSCSNYILAFPEEFQIEVLAMFPLD